LRSKLSLLKKLSLRAKADNADLQPVDWWVHEVVLSYDRKFKKLDSLFNADVVGDGTSNVVEPFGVEKVRFFSGQVSIGWFGQINKDYKTLLKNLPQQAVAGNDGMWISPLVNLDRKGGALQIMIQQFRRAVGVAIVQGNAKHKLGHLHYIRDSME